MRAKSGVAVVALLTAAACASATRGLPARDPLLAQYDHDVSESRALRSLTLGGARAPVGSSYAGATLGGVSLGFPGTPGALPPGPLRTLEMTMTGQGPPAGVAPPTAPSASSSAHPPKGLPPYRSSTPPYVPHYGKW